MQDVDLIWPLVPALTKHFGFDFYHEYVGETYLHFSSNGCLTDEFGINESSLKLNEP